MSRLDCAFFREFWTIAAPYWSSEERGRAWALLGIIIAMNLGTIYISVLINEWNNTFYNALQNLNKSAFLGALLQFAGLASAFIVLAVYQLYLGQMLQIRWRRWLTERYVTRWLDRHTYYRMQLLDRGTDNPDQRISQDIAEFVDRSLNLSLGLLNAVVTLFSFVLILWHLSGSLVFTLGGLGRISIPGYMVWAALGYAIIGTWLTMRVGRPLVGLNFNQQRFEADFRYSLVRLRENSESIALYRGEAEEQANFANRFAAVVENYWQIMRRQKKLTWLTAGYNQAAIIFPILVAAPRFFAKQIKLGGLMQVASAFGQVHGALSYIVNSYSDVAYWKSVVDRLSSFSRNIQHIESLQGHEGINRFAAADGALRIESLSVQLPDGTVLVEDLRLRLEPGMSVLITGPSGSGKSTLIRALAGIWPFGEGVVAIPEHARVMFLPQRPYLPLGTLRQALYYPQQRPQAGTENGRLEELLALCGLGHLADALDRAEDWSHALSLGEQQRIAFARVLLWRPTFVFLDEATASLDEAAEARLYQALKTRLPKAVIVSVGHRSTLTAWHTSQIALTRRRRAQMIA